MKFRYYMPTKLIFGAGEIGKLKRIDLPGKKALVVTGSKAIRKNGYLDMIIGHLNERGVESVVYDKIQPNPLSDHVDEGSGIARRQNCDFVIGLGGGSAIDSAKSIALMANNGGNYWDYVFGGTGGGTSAPNKALPIVAVPTTSGTGTEVDPYSVITKAETREKIGIGRDDFFPALSIVDPDFMLTVPPGMTAHTGMDAFFHAVEAYLSKARQPASNTFALESIRLIAEYLPKAVKDGSDIAARANLAWASTAAGMCETLSGTISQHSMEHALSAFHPDMPHGAGLTMLSEAYFSFLSASIPERFVPLARAMGGNDFIETLGRLIDDIGLRDERLSRYGITPDEFPALAENAFSTMEYLFRMTPVKMEKEDVVSIYRNSYK